MHMYQVTTFKETLHQLPGGSGRGPHPQSVTSPLHYSTTQPLPANFWSKVFSSVFCILDESVKSWCVIDCFTYPPAN
jgi:hypothetical protein